jgi:hypothetical protein
MSGADAFQLNMKIHGRSGMDRTIGLHKNESVLFSIRNTEIWKLHGGVSSLKGGRFFCGEGPRSRCYGRTTALSLIVQPCVEDEEKDDQLFLFFQVIEHRWNESDRGKPKYSGKNLSQCHLVHHKSHMEKVTVTLIIE